MRKRGVSSVIGGILVILIALTAVGAITAYFFWGLHAVNEENQLSNWLTYKDMEQLAGADSVPISGQTRQFIPWLKP